MEDEEQHGERHSLENDYEGGTWIDGEFFYRARREKRHQTEDERLYGVFAGDSEDEDEGGGKRRKKSTADYAKPMKFVSKGVVEPKPLEEGQERKSEPTEAAGSHSISAPAEPGSSDASRDQDDGDADEVLPTAFGRSLKKSIAERRLKQQKRQEASQIRKAVLQADPGLAQFEKTTKGIGSKLLGMMGWKPGEGLGRDRTGRAKPIEVRQRPKDMGLGFDNFQEQPKPAPRAPGPLPDAKTAATAQSQKRGRGSRWRKTQVGVRAKVQYRTPEEVLAEAAAEAAETGAVTEAPQKILDMRGRRVKVLRSLEQLEGVEAEGDEDVDGGGAAGPMPELQHNLQLLVEMAEADIRRLDGRLSSEKDSVVLLGSEGQQLQQRKRLADAELSKMGDLYDRVRRCAQESKTMALESIEQEFLKLQAAFREEYVLFSLPAAALAAGLPHIRERLAAWRPLAQPQAALPLFRTWQRLLQTDSERQAVLARGLDPLGDLAGSSYGLLVLECLLPPLRQDVLETWHPREPEALLNFLDLWEGVLPQAAAAHICEGLVMPRLHAAVEAWQPTRDTVPIHHWLHPWLPHLGPQLENVYPHIRHKVAAALEHWVPNDGSAIVLLEPWAVVFKGQDWEQLMARSILPKLSSALQSLDCAPTSTQLEPFDWVMAWEKLMPLELMAALLDHYFFPRWHQTLHFWLNHSPDYDEVTSWYLGWKRRFPESIWSHERILAHNKAALNVINQAQHGHMPTQYDIPLPGPAPFALAGGGGNAAAAAASYAAAGAAAGAAAAPEPELSLKQAVEMYAAEHGVEFQPKPGRYFQGKPVYSFGGISMVIDSTAAVLRANLGSGYLPISLAQLAQEYASRAPAAVAR